jgi:hypothetical protein
LKAKVALDGAGGVGMLIWHDTQLNDDCWFFTAADGALRCIPLYSAPYAVEGFFSDSSCTQPLVEGYRTCAGAPTRAVRYDLTACPMRMRMFAVGQQVTAATLYFKSTPTSCSTRQVQANEVWYALGAELPATTFVRGTAMPGPNSGVSLASLVADDGAHSSWMLHDNSGNFDCYANPMANGDTRCIPYDTLSSAGEFSDSSCTMPAFTKTTGACPAPTFGLRYAATGASSCVADNAYSRVGPPISTYYRSSGSSCTASQSSSAWQDYAAGAPVPASTFGLGTPSLAAAGRLQRTTLTWPGGARTLGGWRDTQLGEECVWWYAAADGSRRCLPSTPGASMSSYFADSACTAPLARVAFSGSACTPRYALDYFNNCAMRSHVFQVGALHTGPVYSSSSTGCAVTTTTETLYRTTGELAPSAMAPLTEALQ